MDKLNKEKIKKIIKDSLNIPFAGKFDLPLFIIFEEEKNKRLIKEILETTNFKNINSLNNLNILKDAPYFILLFSERGIDNWKENAWMLINSIINKSVNEKLNIFPFVAAGSNKIKKLFNIKSKNKLFAILTIRKPEKHKKNQADFKTLEKKIIEEKNLNISSFNIQKIAPKQENLIRNVINDVEIFSKLPDRVKEELLSMLHVKEINKNEEILKKGEPAGDFYIIISGIMEVVGKDKNNREQIITFLQKGDCFGEMSIITNEPVAATIRTNTKATLLLLKKHDLLYLLEEYPKINVFFVKLISKRLRKTNLKFLQESITKGVKGQLSILSLPEILQAIKMSGKSGVLSIKSDNNKSGTIGFKDGEIINCLTSSKKGDKAFYEILQWDKGEYRFSNEKKPGKENVTQSTMGLLMEGLRLIDESSK